MADPNRTVLLSCKFVAKKEIITTVDIELWLSVTSL